MFILLRIGVRFPLAYFYCWLCCKHCVGYNHWSDVIYFDVAYTTCANHNLHFVAHVWHCLSRNYTRRYGSVLQILFSLLQKLSLQF